MLLPGHGTREDRLSHDEARAQARPPGPSILVVMGVSGSGKTTIGERLAARLGWPYQEGDALHPPANVAKMHSGTPLDDADRLPWLQTIAAHIDEWRAKGSPGILTCSALKRRYRDIIIGDRPDVRLVYLKGSKDEIGGRLADRQGHFMPAALLKSQFEALEEPGPDERPITVSVDGTPDEIVDDLLGRLGDGQRR
jgi:gluconokinase